MSQAPTDLGSMRFLFEGDPSTILSAFDRIDSSAQETAASVESSAGKIERAVSESLGGVESKTNRYYRLLREQNKAAGEEIRQNLALTRRLSGITEGSVSSATSGMASGFGRVSARIDQGTEGLRRMQGTLTSTIGIATGVIAVFALLTNGIKQAVDQSKQYEKSIEGISQQRTKMLQDELFAQNNLSGSGQRANEIRREEREQIAAINDELDKLLQKRSNLKGQVEGFLSSFAGGKTTKEAIKDAEDAIARIQRSTKEAAGVAERNDRDALIRIANEAAERQRVQNIADPMEREREIHRERLRNIHEQFGELRESNRDLYDRLIEEERERHRQESRNIDERRNAEIDAEKKRQEAIEETERKKQESHQRDLQRAQELADKIREENFRIINDAAQGLQQSFGEANTRLLETIVKKIDRVGRAARNGG